MRRKTREEFIEEAKRVHGDKYNAAIEYQGRQHFSKQTKFADDFKNVVERDKAKLRLCEEHDIKLYHLSFETRFIPSDFDTYYIYDNLDEIMGKVKRNEL